MEYAIYRFLTGIFAFRMNDRILLKRHGIAHVETYDVTADELDRLESEGGDVGFDFHICSFCLTLATSFLLGLILSPPPDNRPKLFVVLVVIVVVGFLMGAIFAVKWFRSRGAFSKTIRRIRDRQIGPVGEKGNELAPSELGALPSEESGGPEAGIGK
jgi:hypothetical protein